MFTRSMIKAAAPFAAVAALVSATAATASKYDVSAKVEVAGLDLTSAAGRAVLDRRIAMAARQVCAVGKSRDLVMIAHERNCYAGAIESSREQVSLAVSRANERLASNDITIRAAR